MFYDYLFNISLLISAITLWNIFVKNSKFSRLTYIFLSFAFAGILIVLIEKGINMEFGHYKLNFSHIPVILLILSGHELFSLLGVFIVSLYYGFEVGFLSDAHNSLILYLSVVLFIGIQIKKRSFTKCQNWTVANIVSIVWMVVHALFFYSAEILSSFIGVGFIGLNFITSNIIYIIYKKIKNDETVWNKIKEESIIDFLTGAYNKRKFKEDFENTKQNEETQRISIIMFDIDHFKTINDTYGHGFGDIILKDVSKHLKTVSENVYRIGGEEFLMMFVNADDRLVRHSAELVRESIAKEIWNPPGGQTLQITISSGIASCDQSLFDTIDVVDEADKKLYLAKATGRNRCCF